jgi:hypothetical protein
MIREAITRGLLIAERLVVATERIAKELHELNETLYHLTFDPNCETTLDRIHTDLHDNLQTFPGSGEERSLAGHVARLADRGGDR